MALTTAQGSSYLETMVLNSIFRAGTWTDPVHLYYGLSSTAPTDNTGAGITEPTIGTNGYARAQLDGASGNYAAPSASGTGEGSSNSAAITWPTSTGAWLSGSTLLWGFVSDASSAGNFLLFWPLTTGQTVASSGITVSYPITTGLLPSAV